MPPTGPSALPPKRPITILASIAVCMLWYPGALFAQQDIRNLSGTVTDRQHEPLRGAVVQVQEEGTQIVASYITDRQGHYRFRHLRGSTDYLVWATYRNQKSKEKTISQFDARHNVKIDLIIKLE